MRESSYFGGSLGLLMVTVIIANPVGRILTGQRNGAKKKKPIPFSLPLFPSSLPYDPPLPWRESSPPNLQNLPADFPSGALAKIGSCTSISSAEEVGKARVSGCVCVLAAFTGEDWKSDSRQPTHSRFPW